MDKKYNLLVLASTFPRYPKDSEPRFVYDLCRHLLDRFNITVLVPSFPGAAKEEIMDGIRIIRFRYAPDSLQVLAYPGAIMSRIYEKPIRSLLVPGFMITLYCNLKKLLRAEKFDVLHINWLIPQGIAAGLISKKIMPPFMLSGLGGDVFSLNYPIIKQLKQRVLKRASKVVMLSQYLKHYLLEHFRINQDINVIPIGCDLTLFGPQNYEPDFYKKRYNADGPVVLFVGRLAEKKGVKYLLDAVALPELARLEFTVIIAGDGTLQGELKEQSMQLNISHKVKFIGNKTHEELAALYANAGIFCAPSVTAEDGDQESWGVVIIEASASGIPVITTKRGEDETVLHKKTGLVIEQKNVSQLASAIKELLLSERLRKKYGEAAREHALQFSWEQIAKQYGDMYEDIIYEFGAKR